MTKLFSKYHFLFFSTSLLLALASCRPGGQTGEGRSAGAPAAAGQARKLILAPDMLINEVAKGDAGLLVDEQGPAGEAAPRGARATTWSVKVPEGEVDWYLPANAVIDLGREFVITRVFLYDGDGLAGNCHLSYGLPFRWQRLLTDPLVNANTWNEHAVDNIRTRYLQISKETDADMREIVLYGYPVGEAPAPQAAPAQAAVPAPRQRVPIYSALGVNSYIDDPFERVQPVAGIVREYHHWHYNEGGYMQGYPGYPDNQIQWSPASAGGPNFNSIRGYPNDLREWKPEQRQGLDFDAYYKRMKEADILVFPVIQGNVPWLTGEPEKTSRRKPVPEGADPADPASYAAHADFMFQYAARYGRTRVEDRMLKLAPNQARVSGLGYLEYIENWNEPDGWWGGRSDYFSPYEYAAMSSADYDGHEGTMGRDKGIKNADPRARLVMGGIAIPSPDYIRAMEFWFAHNRKDQRFVFDVITVHHYCNEGGGQAVMSKGISPEEDDLRGVMQKIVDLRDARYPDKEVWMTEFGWDTNPVTPQAAPSEEVQGQWLTRAFLACFAGGMDRVAMYMLPDVDQSRTTQFTSSGLIGPRDNPYPKPSWYYVSTLRNQLSDMVFHGEQPSGSEQVRIYKFKSLKTGKGAYVLWSPTTNGTAVPGYQLALEGAPASAVLVTMQPGQTNGAARQLTINNGTVPVDVSERPVFVQVDRMP